MKKYTVGIVVSHPIQYQVPLYRYLEEHSFIKPVVMFLTNHGIKESFDPGFSMTLQYDIPLLDGYEYKFLKNISPKPNPSMFTGAFNPGIVNNISGKYIDLAICHGWNSMSMIMAILTANVKHIPYMLRGEARPDPISMSTNKKVLKHMLLEPLITRASACLSIGKENSDFYRGYGVADSKIFEAPYSVDTIRFETFGRVGRDLRSNYLRKLNLNPELPTVMFASKMHPRKNPIDLIYAVDKMDSKPNLIFIGDGQLMDQVKQLALKRPWIGILGFINQVEIPVWLGVADILVLPSSHEPWGLIVNEAMSAGCIPIVSDSVGCRKDLVTEDIGEIFPTGNIDELALAIGRVIRQGIDKLRRQKSIEKSAEYSIAATSKGIEAAVEFIIQDY